METLGAAFKKPGMSLVGTGVRHEKYVVLRWKQPGTLEGLAKTGGSQGGPFSGLPRIVRTGLPNYNRLHVNHHNLFVHVIYLNSHGASAANYR